MKETIKMTMAILLCSALTYAGYQHGLTVGSLSASQDFKTLQNAGYIQEPYFVDTPVKEWRK